MKAIAASDTAALNAAFAERVAGYECAHEWFCSSSRVPKRGSSFACRKCGRKVRGGGNARIPPDFCASMDAVLPWLEKWRLDVAPQRSININQANNCAMEWHVSLLDEEDGSDSFAADKSLPHACVIALLRAHGVEVSNG